MTTATRGVDLVGNHKIKNLSDEELRELVLGVCDGRIFTSGMLRDMKDLPVVFLVVALGLFSGWTKEEIEDVGEIYEYLSAAGERGVNGYPCFMSCHLVNKADWARASEAIKKELDRRKSIEV